jgi:hypothetical protein
MLAGNDIPAMKVYSHHIFTSDQCICNTNDKTSHMTITYIARICDVSSVLSKKLTHVVLPIVDRPRWFLVALYNRQVVI